ncbi:ankyrin repeat-containing domain protein [Halenospora varia]|nr:ankyrin repeat-containing domain protein [Halenospora varia]
MAAASNGKHEIIRLLIARGADVMKKDDRKSGSGGSAIDAAAANGHETLVRELLDKGAVLTTESAHIKGYSSNTALQALSSRDDSAALTRLLLENGADVDAVAKVSRKWRTAMQERPLHLTVEYGEPANLQVLLEYGADVSHRGFGIYTLLQLAIKREQHSLASISALLSVKGIDINAKSKDYVGDTALHMAVRSGKLDLVEILLDHGADINEINTKKETALIAEVIHCPLEKYPQAIHLLVEKGADIEMVDVDGNTALMVAAKHRSQSVEVIQILLEKGAESSINNFEGFTALMLAADCGNLLAVECLLQHTTSQKLEENGEVGALWGQLFEMAKLKPREFS